MFSLEDCVVNLKTGDSGKVIGYGHIVADGTYEPTLKVLVQSKGSHEKGIVVEDLSSAWFHRDC